MTRRILIVDGVATNRILLAVTLKAARHDTLVAEDAGTGLALARAERPDLVLLDGRISAPGAAGFLRGLRADPATAEIPVIVMLAEDEGGARRAALELGADDVMAKPPDQDRLLARLRALMRARETTREMRARDAALGPVGMTEGAAAFQGPGLVALLCDDADRARGLCAALSPLMPDRVEPRARDLALSLSDVGARAAPDVYVIGGGGTGTCGALRLVADLRSRGESRHAAICLLQDGTDAEAEVMALDMGADDVVPADADPRELSLRLRRLMERKRQDDRLRAALGQGLRLAVIDPLTGLHNRRYALAQLGRIAERAGGAGGYAVLVIDLDHFKTVNDALGHAAGDAVLTEVGRRMASVLRPGDLLGRIGGEEFLVALPETGLAGAAGFAERLCRAVERTSIFPARRTPVRVTISVGLAVSSPVAGQAAESALAVLARADRALFQSKARGRNRVTIDRSAA